MHLRAHTPGVVTGKPVNIGGSRGRVEATGRGVMIAIEAALEKSGKSLAGHKVVVQGFGNVGSISAKLLRDAGAVIVGISDVTGGYFDKRGIDVDAAIAHVAKSKNKTLDGFGAERLDNAALLELPCDILVPAALENQLTESNARKLKAHLIAEGCNGPSGIRPRNTRRRCAAQRIRSRSNAWSTRTRRAGSTPSRGVLRAVRSLCARLDNA